MNSGFGTNNTVEAFYINDYKIIVSNINDERGEYTAYNIFKSGFICIVIRNDIEKVKAFCQK